MLDACFTSMTNTPAIVSEYLEQIDKLRKELPEGSEDPVGPNDLFAQVIGQDKPGRVRMFGEGVAPSDVWGEVPNKNRCKRIMLEQRSEILKLKKEFTELKSQRFTPVISTPQNSQSLKPLPNNLLRPASTMQHLQNIDLLDIQNTETGGKQQVVEVAVDVVCDKGEASGDKNQEDVHKPIKGASTVDGGKGSSSGGMYFINMKM